MSSYRTSREVRRIGSLVLPEQPEWFRRAACFRIGLELFFGPGSDVRRETPTEKEEREDRARAVCAGCAVRVQCKEYATGFSNGLQIGVWHGGNDFERKIDRRKELRKAAAQRRKAS
jgi:WhiB family redox-sensing transcriptional regulator